VSCRPGSADERLSGTRGAAGDILARNGYEPRTVDDEVILANCPLRSLAEHYTELCAA
jgi:predicted ArsR family transcriptional regulator